MILHNPFGPIFEKELRATSRRKRTYVLRGVYLLGLLLFLVLVYVDNASWSRNAGIAQRVAQQNQLGRNFFICFSLFCVGAMAMIGPVLTSTAISAERLHKTLPVLLMTPITSWQIITGKLFSRLLVALTLIGLSLPVLALVRLLGGVEVEQMFGVLVLATTTALATAALGLFASTFVNRAYAAILLSYAAILVLWVFGPILVMVWSSGGGPPRMNTVRFLCVVSPFISTGFLATPAGAMFASPWALCAGVQVAVTGGLIGACAGMLRRLQRREGRDACEHVVPAADAAAPGAVQEDVTVDAKRAQRGRRSAVADNPVLWRELGRPLFPKRWHSRLAGVLLAALLVVSYAAFHSADLLDDHELQFPYAVIFNGVTWLVLSVLAATAIAQEKESDTWTLLLATPIAARAIVFGKILGLYRRLLWPALLVAAHFFIFAATGVISWVAAAFVMWIILSFNTVWVASGVCLSLKLHKVTFAVILNLALAMALYVALPIVLAIATELTPGPDESIDALAWGLPYFYLIGAIEIFSPRFDPQRIFSSPGFGDVPARDLLLGGLVVGALHIVVAGVVVMLTLGWFNRIVGRAEQRDPAPALGTT